MTFKEDTSDRHTILDMMTALAQGDLCIKKLIHLRRDQRKQGHTFWLR